MTEQYTKSELAEILQPVGQEHLLRFWDELTAAEQAQLGAQIKSVDWPQVLSWFAEVMSGDAEAGVPFERLTPAPYVPLIPENADQEQLQAKAIAAGEELLRQGKVAAFTVAGGQGTRLGYDGPKGTYCFSPLENKSLFQYFAEAILCNQQKYNTVIPWYIMTSPANHADTTAFFQANNFFGLNADDVHFFTQGTLPGFSKDGKALLETKSSLALFANGHGGTFAALRDSGTVKDMADRGIEYLSYWQVDNPLVTVCDPLFIGLHHLQGSDMSARALIKRDAMEKLGHFCILDGRTIIIEYSDMPTDLLEKRDADSRLTFRAGSPAIHIISRSFIEGLTNGTLKLTPHRATKKISYIDENGNKVTPDSPNGTKLEFFIFDALPLANKPLILEADRNEQFAAIKNAEGQDSPDSCRADLLARTRRWLAAAGVTVPESAIVEIALSKAVCPADVAALVRAGVIPSEIGENARISIK